MDRQDALLEIGCEELPVDYIAPALQQLRTAAETRLRDLRLEYASVETEATPRRLVLYIKGLAAEQPQQSKVVSGPTLDVAVKSDGTLTAAGEGFLRKLGVTADKVEVREGRWTVQVLEKSRATLEILPEVFPALMQGLTFPKSMHWEASGARFARPVRWLAALFGSKIIPFNFADVAAGRGTRLHPLNKTREAEIPQAEQYFGLLEQGQVSLSVSRRRSAIASDLARAAQPLGGRVVSDEDLLDKVTMMAEFPRVLSGAFGKSFLDLPREIVITAMREHQRYFAVEDAHGRLLPGFLAVYDNPLADPASLQPGCERVLAARLKDAEFFYREDLKRPLAELVPALDRVLWIKGLGSLLDKTRRLESLAGWLASQLEPEAAADAVQAAHLSKADLVTHMVQEKEFTSLQGVIGTYYALAQGVVPGVALALREHYQPRSAGDACPQSPAGRILALTDKLDHLVGCWGSGLIPTGTRDPYALRRAAQGVVAITLEAGYRFSLLAALRRAAEGFPQFAASAEACVQAVRAFIVGRLETELTQRQFPPDVMQAVLLVWNDDLYAVLQKAETLVALQRRPNFLDAIVIFSRVVNILPKHTPRSVPPGEPELPVTVSLMTESAERELQAAYLKLRDKVRLLSEAGDYFALFDHLAEAAPLINRFFDDVLVMAPESEVRENRLNLLTNLARTYWLLADFSRLVPKEPAGAARPA